MEQEAEAGGYFACQQPPPHYAHQPAYLQQQTWYGLGQDGSDGAQRSAASAGGGRPAASDCQTALLGECGGGFVQQQAHQQHRQQQLGAMQGGELDGGADDIEGMRALIAQQMAMREQLLQRSQRLAAEVQRREAVAANGGFPPPPQQQQQGQPAGNRSSALAAAAELKALLSSLPPGQRRAYAGELMRRRGQLLAAGASGAGVADVAAAALQHCKMLMVSTGGQQQSQSQQQLVSQLSTRVSHHGEGGRLRAAQGGGADSAGRGDTTASEVQQVVQGMVRDTAAALDGTDAGGSPSSLCTPPAGGLAAAAEPEDRCSPNVRSAAAAAAAAGRLLASVTTSCGSPSSATAGGAAGGNAAAAADGALPCPDLDDAAMGGLLAGDDLGGVDAGLLDDFLDDFLAGEEGAMAPAAAATMFAPTPMPAAPAGRSGGGAVPPGIGSASAPSFSSWAEAQRQQQAAAALAAAAHDPPIIAIGDAHSPVRAWDAAGGSLAHFGMHPAHLSAAHHGLPHSSAAAVHRVQCSAHAVRSSAPGAAMGGAAVTPFAHAANDSNCPHGTDQPAASQGPLQHAMSAPAGWEALRDAAGLVPSAATQSEGPMARASSQPPQRDQRQQQQQQQSGTARAMAPRVTIRLSAAAMQRQVEAARAAGEAAGSAQGAASLRKRGSGSLGTAEPPGASEQLAKRRLGNDEADSAACGPRG